MWIIDRRTIILWLELSNQGNKMCFSHWKNNWLLMFALTFQSYNCTTILKKRTCDKLLLKAPLSCICRVGAAWTDRPMTLTIIIIWTSQVLFLCGTESFSQAGCEVLIWSQTSESAIMWSQTCGGWRSSWPIRALPKSYLSECSEISCVMSALASWHHTWNSSEKQ